jgi:tetratricopeptide (TPR) repeat protein
MWWLLVAGVAALHHMVRLFRFGHAQAGDIGIHVSKREPFLGRAAEIERWKHHLAGLTRRSFSPHQSFVTLVYGIGGLGKSTLVRKLLEPEGGIAAIGGASVLVDLEDERQRWPERYPPLQGPSLGTVLFTIERAIVDRLGRSADQAFGEFRGTLAEILSLVSQPERDALARDDAVPPDSELDGATAAANLVAGLLGVPVPASAVAAGLAIGETARRGGRSLRVRWRRRGLTPETPRISQRRLALRLEPERVLVEAFARGVHSVTSDRPLVIAVDTAEIATPMIGALRRVTAETGSRTMWLLAGRFDTPAEAGYASAIGEFERAVGDGLLATVPLPVFDRELQRLYLAARVPRISWDASNIAKVDEATHGIPLALWLVADLLHAGADISLLDQVIGERGEASTVVRRLAHRFLHHALDDHLGLTNPLRADLSQIFGLAVDQMSEAGKVIGYDVQRKMVAALLGVDVADLAGCLEQLSARHDFVSAASGRVHGEVARVLRDYLLDADQRMAYAAMHERICNVVRSEVTAQFHDVSLGERFESEVWRLLAGTFVRHQFWISNDLGLAALISIYPGAHVLAPDVARAIAAIPEPFYATGSERQKGIIRGLRGLQRRYEFGQVDGRGIPLPTVADRDAALRALGAPTEDTVLVPDRDLRAGLVALMEAQLALDAGDHPAAMATLTEVDRRLPPGDGLVDAAFASAVARIDGYTVDNEQLLCLCDQAVARTNKNGHLYARRAVTLVILGNLDEAILSLELAEQLEYSTEFLLSARSILLARLGRFEDALKVAEAAIENAPRSADCHARYAYRLMNLGRADEAVDAARQAVALRPSMAAAHVSLGDTLFNTGDADGALEAYEAAVQQQPNDAQALHALGQELALRGDPRAGDMLDRCLRVQPSHTLARLIRAILSWTEGDDHVVDVECGCVLRETAVFSPPFEEALSRAVAHLLVGEPDRALKLVSDTLHLRGEEAVEQRLFKLLEASREPPVGLVELRALACRP